MVVGVTKIPWFSYSPFHAAMEIITSRMLISLYKSSMVTREIGPIKQSTIAVFSSVMETQHVLEMKETDIEVLT